MSADGKTFTSLSARRLTDNRNRTIIESSFSIPVREKSGNQSTSGLTQNN
ncbi:MAG TPA: hypothetical protein VF596_19820 [Pyrinomonadaceae bacterium]